MSEDVIWHDVECGSYRADLELWRQLAAAADGPVLDVGAGTGRVAIDLAARGADVTALDADEALLAALTQRAAARGLAIETVCADAREWSLARDFALILVPMQTLQLLGGPDGRMAFLRCARAHLRPGGLVAAAIADALEATEEAVGTLLPEPDRAEVDGRVYLSRPLAIVDEGDRAAIHRLREVVGGATTEDVIRLDHVDAATVEREAAAVGLTPAPSRRIPATDEYVGSTVVVLRG